MKIGLIAFLLLSVFGLGAQEYSISVSNASQTTLNLKEINRVHVEEYSGNTIVVSKGDSSSRPNRAEGLKALSARGDDNTGIGLNMDQSGADVTLFQVARRAKGVYKVRVPKGVKVNIEHTGNWEGGKIEVYNISSELEISGRYNSVYMEDITGPALVNTMYGGIEAKFSSLSQQGPTSLLSMYSTVDVTLPANAKADVTIKTPYGEAYSDMDIKIPTNEDGMRKVSSTIDGQLNGGGVELALKASYSNVYLRKK